jgi:hypothetical protein
MSIFTYHFLLPASMGASQNLRIIGKQNKCKNLCFPPPSLSTWLLRLHPERGMWHRSAVKDVIYGGGDQRERESERLSNRLGLSKFTGPVIWGKAETRVCASSCYLLAHGVAPSSLPWGGSRSSTRGQQGWEWDTVAAGPETTALGGDEGGGGLFFFLRGRRLDWRRGCGRELETRGFDGFLPGKKKFGVWRESQKQRAIFPAILVPEGQLAQDTRESSNTVYLYHALSKSFRVIQRYPEGT